MTNEEFSNSFDTLLNSYNIQAGFGEGVNKQGAITLDEYEKSVLLTQAQDSIVKSYFDRTLNNQGQGFDDSARRQVDFSSLIKVKVYNSNNTQLIHDDTCYDKRGLKVKLAPNILFMLNEKIEIGIPEASSAEDTDTYVVVPINYREYDREMSKAYAQPLKKQAWRLFSNAATGYDIQSEIIPIHGTATKTTDTYYKRTDNTWKTYTLKPGDNVEGIFASKNDFPSVPEGTILQVRSTQRLKISYVIRYVERPTPIVLRDLPNELTIDNVSTETPCSLNPVLHMDILNKAFELAITTRGGGTAQRQQENSRNQRE